MINASHVMASGSIARYGIVQPRFDPMGRATGNTATPLGSLKPRFKLAMTQPTVLNHRVPHRLICHDDQVERWIR
jgi:hypothetical protein